MVEAVRGGSSMRSVARRFGTSLLTVQRWVARAGDAEPDLVDWSDRSRAPHRTRHVGVGVEDEVVRLRLALTAGVLGESGPDAIHAALDADPAFAGRVPSVRTIARILGRQGLLADRRRVRRPPPPPGWYLPDVASRDQELDSFDVIDDHHLTGSGVFQVLTGVSLHGGLPVAWVGPPLTGRAIVGHLLEHWAEVGLPGYAQFDNDTRFHGSHGYPDVLGPVVRACLALAVVPVFAPPGEHGFQNAVEGLNGRWEARVFHRRHHDDLEDLAAHSDAWVHALRARLARRIEAAPERREPPRQRVHADPPPSGRMAFPRRTTDAGEATVLGRPYAVDRAWPHRLVRADLDLDARTLSFVRLRRREPGDQQLLAVHPYEPVTSHVHPRRRRGSRATSM